MLHLPYLGLLIVTNLSFFNNSILEMHDNGECSYNMPLINYNELLRFAVVMAI